MTLGEEKLSHKTKRRGRQRRSRRPCSSYQLREHADLMSEHLRAKTFITAPSTTRGREYSRSQ